MLENSSLHLAVYSSVEPEDARQMVMYHWLLNGSTINGIIKSPDGRNVTIPSVQFQGNVQYSCRAVLFFESIPSESSAHFLVTIYGEYRPH